MIKKLLIVALSCLLCFSVLFGCNTNAVDEEILPAETIYISTASELVAMQKYTGKKYSNYVFELKNDIDLSAIETWEPIGKDITTSFMGKFDGKGYKISNLTLKGWEDNGNPTFVGNDSNVINETSYCSIGLFGYTKDTEISNLTLKDINIYYYTQGVASYTAALVGYDTGTSKFSNITSSGSIKLSNIYNSVKTYDNTGAEQGAKEGCPTVQYAGGVVAYSSGSSEFSDIISSVNIENSLYKAIYKQANKEMGIEEGYSIRTDNDKSILPEQTIAGGAFGLLRGATLNNITSTAMLTIKAKSSYIGGAVAALYSGSAKNFNVDGVKIDGKITTKNTIGGAVALLDYSTFSESTLNNVEIVEQCQGNEVQSASVGGAVGYAYDNSTIKDITITKLSIKSGYNKSILGGIVGVVRDSVLKDCSVSQGEFAATSLGKNNGVDEYDQFFATCAVIVGAVYGNASVSDCMGSISNKYVDGLKPNQIAYGTKNSTIYVNEDGYDAIRLFKEGSLTEYIVAYAKYSEGKLDVIFYSEESKILSEQSYNSVAVIQGTESDSIKYKDVFFTKGQGIIGTSGDVLTFEGRDTTKYVYLSGVPYVDEATLNVAMAG